MAGLVTTAVDYWAILILNQWILTVGSGTGHMSLRIMVFLFFLLFFFLLLWWPLQKSLKLHCFKPNRDEIWRSVFQVHSSINAVGFSNWRNTVKMEAHVISRRKVLPPGECTRNVRSVHNAVSIPSTFLIRSTLTCIHLLPNWCLYSYFLAVDCSLLDI